MKHITLPLTENSVKDLKAGDCVLITGTVLTARDCAHKRILAYLNCGKKLPFELEGSVIYYAGPCPAKPDRACGSCGPTTSARMNAFAPQLLNSGLAAIIGKGEMAPDVREAIIRNRSVYFAAIGGAGALYADCIKKCECIAFEDLLSEAVFRLEVEDFPAIVAYDCFGGDVYGR